MRPLGASLLCLALLTATPGHTGLLRTDQEAIDLLPFVVGRWIEKGSGSCAQPLIVRSYELRQLGKADGLLCRFTVLNGEKPGKIHGTAICHPDQTQSEIEIQTNTIPVKITVRRPDGSKEVTRWEECPSS